MSLAPHRFTVRVYYEDTDFSGVVYHANYLRYFERGRTEMLRTRGIGQAELFADGGAGSFGFAVAGMEIAFRRPARMDDMSWMSKPRSSRSAERRCGCGSICSATPNCWSKPRCGSRRCPAAARHGCRRRLRQN